MQKSSFSKVPSAIWVNKIGRRASPTPEGYSSSKLAAAHCSWTKSLGTNPLKFLVVFTCLQIQSRRRVLYLNWLSIRVPFIFAFLASSSAWWRKMTQLNNVWKRFLSVLQWSLPFLSDHCKPLTRVVQAFFCLSSPVVPKGSTTFQVIKSPKVTAHNTISHLLS